MSITKKQKIAFEYEKTRNNLAIDDLKNNIKLIKYYSKHQPEITGTNKGIFWDKTLQAQSTESNINRIEHHRINLFKYEIEKRSKNKSIILLDIGIGNGLIENGIYANKNIKLNGIDISKYAIKKANSKFEGIFKLGEITSIPFEDSLFDIVVASEVLEHVPPSSTFQALSEIKRVLKPNGYLFLSVPVNENLEELINKTGINPNQHARAYTKNTIRMELKLNGFGVNKTHELYAFSNLYHVKTTFIKLARLFKIKVLPNTQINNLVIFAQKK